MILNISYWAWFGTLYLLILTYKDLKNSNRVDTRYNYVMIGISLSLTSHVNFVIWRILILLIVIFSMAYFLHKYKALGLADIQSLGWIFLGFTMLNINYLIWFVIIFIAVTLLYLLLKMKLIKYEGPAPFFPVILACFIFTCWLFGLYSNLVG